MLNGYKTYIVAAIAAVLAACEVLGYQVPEWVIPMLMAAGLYSARSAVWRK